MILAAIVIDQKLNLLHPCQKTLIQVPKSKHEFYLMDFFKALQKIVPKKVGNHEIDIKTCFLHFLKSNAAYFWGG